jgi:hypothetical protein
MDRTATVVNQAIVAGSRKPQPKSCSRQYVILVQVEKSVPIDQVEGEIHDNHKVYVFVFVMTST